MESQNRGGRRASHSRRTEHTGRIAGVTSIQIARELVAQLVAAGVRHVVLSPGSRSAPLAYALADAHDAGWLRLTVRIDERSAAFTALGMTRAGGTRQPAAVVTTSGTAVANLHPAVLEASHSGDPLVVVTADRPHEMLHTGANQTTIQSGIFGNAVRAHMDIPVGFRQTAVRGAVTRMIAAATGAMTSDSGPVHLNVSFREPLVPSADAQDLDTIQATPEWIRNGIPPAVAMGTATPEPILLAGGKRTVVVAGDSSPQGWLAKAATAQWPVFAEPSSGLRRDGAILHYLSIVRSPLAAEIERVVVIGHPTLSRPISSLLAREDVEMVVISGFRYTDVAGRASIIAGDAEVPNATSADREWMQRWIAADHEMAQTAASGLTAAEEAACAVWEAPAPTLMLGSSATIRAIDAYGGPRNDGHVVANRGLAGIDGTVSTALGLALGTRSAVRVLTGDLTFLHDATGLLRGAMEDDVDLQVIVVNDGGGTIFRSLEPGALAAVDRRQQRIFDRFFLTPQVARLSALADGVDASYTRVENLAALKELLAQPVNGRSVVEYVVPGALP